MKQIKVKSKDEFFGLVWWKTEWLWGHFISETRARSSRGCLNSCVISCSTWLNLVEGIVLHFGKCTYFTFLNEKIERNSPQSWVFFSSKTSWSFSLHAEAVLYESLWLLSLCLVGPLGNQYVTCVQQTHSVKTSRCGLTWVMCQTVAWRGAVPSWSGTTCYLRT